MVSRKKYQPLALIAGDKPDLEILSACLQDSLIKVGDVAYLTDQRRFAFVANRFCWEIAGTAKRGPFFRVRAGVHFDDVLSVQTRNISRDNPEALISVLSVSYEGDEDGGTVTLFCAGGGAIALKVEAINSSLSDITAPWPTQNRPDHQKGDA